MLHEVKKIEEPLSNKGIGDKGIGDVINNMISNNL